MPWCPKCKNEYKDGVTTCSDCGCGLVAKEEDIKRPITFGEQEEMEELLAFFTYSGLEEAVVSYDETEEVYELSVPEKEIQKAEKLLLIYRYQKGKELSEKTDCAQEEASEEKEAAKSSPLYENSAAKAEDNKSSAYTLLGVGIVGMIVIVLGITGVLPFQLSGTSKYMTYGIMSALFLLFIVMGLVSMKSYRIFAKKAESENSLRDTMEKWCLENLKQEELDAALFDGEEELTEEERYFRRFGLVKEKVEKQFMNLEEAFLDNFVDEIYSGIFEEG